MLGWKKREKRYEQLNAEKRATIMLMRQEGSELCAIGAISEARSQYHFTRARTDSKSGYIALQAGTQASRLRTKPRKALKLVMGNALFEIVVDYLKKNWSPEQIAGTLQRMYPDNPQQGVSHETIYHTLYAMPRGELRRELIASLRGSRDKRRPKTPAPSGCGHIMAMQSIHLHPPEVAGRLIPGHWECRYD